MGGGLGAALSLPTSLWVLLMTLMLMTLINSNYVSEGLMVTLR